MAPFSSEDDEKLIKYVAKNPPIYDCSLSAYRDNIIRDNIWKDIAAAINKTDEECKKRWRNIRDSYFRYKRKNKLPTGSSAEQKPPKWILFNRLLFLDKVSRERLSTTNLNEDETENIDNVDATEQTNNEKSETQLLSNNAENVATSAETTTTLTGSIDAVSLEAASMRLTNRKKRKTDASNNEIIELLKKREEQRQQNFKGMYQEAQTSKDSPLNSFCEHIKLVLEALPPLLQVEAKKEIYNTISKYELQAAKTSLHHKNNYDYLGSSNTHSSTSTQFPRNESSLSGHTEISNHTPFTYTPIQSPRSLLSPQNCSDFQQEDSELGLETLLLKFN